MNTPLDKYQKRIAELEAANRKLQDQLTETQKGHQQTIQELQFVRAQLSNTHTLPSKKVWQLVLDNMPEATFWKDKNSVYLGCNRQFSKAAGLATPEEIIGKTDFDLPWKPEEAEWFRECDHRIMQLGTSELGIIEPQRQADGRQYWIETNKVPLHNAQGNVVGILGTFLDITARVEAENQLKQLNEELERRVEERTQELQTSEARIQRLADNLPGLIFQFRLEANGNRSFPYVSEGCRDIYELEPDSFLRCFDLAHDRDRDALEQAIQISALTLSGFHHEHRIITPSGKLKWVQTIARPERQADDSILWDGLIIEVSDRKQAEKEQQRLLSILEATPDIVCIADPQGNHLYLNRAGQSLLEISQEEVAQISVTECHPIRVLQKLRTESIPTAIQSNMWQGESWLKGQKSGREFPVSQVLLSHRDEDGNLEFLSSIMRDISDLKAAQQAVQENEAKYQQILDSITDMVLVKREKSRIVWANQAFRDYYNMSNEHLQELIDADFNNPDFTQQYIQDDSYVFTSGQSLEIEEPVTRHDGEVRQFNTIKSAIRNSRGEIILTVGVSRDITDRKQAEKRLRQQEAQYRQQAQRELLLNQIANQIRTSLKFDRIVNTTVQAIKSFLNVDRCHFAWYVQTADDAYWDVIAEVQAPDLPSFIGKHFATSFGCLTDRLLNQQILRLDDVVTISDDATRAAVIALGNKSMLVLPILAESGQIGIIACIHSQTIRPWLDDEIELLKAVVAQLEIAINQANLLAQSQTRAQELEVLLTQLQRAQSQLVQSEKMSSLGQMVAGVAHEINNPVSFIYGNLAHAKDYTQGLVKLIENYQRHYPQVHPDIQITIDEIELEFLKQDLPKLFQSMEVGTERIREIIKSLRMFSRLDEAEVKQVDLHDGLDSTLTILQTRLRAQNWRPEIQVIKEYGKLPQIECYAGQLNQVFMNLLGNAVDAMNERDQERTWQQMETLPSTLKIRTQLLKQLPHPAVVISISDNGTGVSQHAMEQLFNPFFTTKPVGQGTGLGLSISYQIITETHGGTITYDSVLGEGTTFTITLPIKQ